MPNTQELLSAKTSLELTSHDVLLSGLDSAMTNRNLRRMACFPYTLPEETLKASLALALQENPALTGRLVSGEDNRTYLRCNNMGLLLVVKYNEAPIPNYGYENSPQKHIKNYVARLSSNKIDNDKPLVSVQINYFQNGMIIGFANDHSLMDGTMAWELFNRWGDYTREPRQPAKAYCLDRAVGRDFDNVLHTEPATSNGRLSHLTNWGRSKLFVGLLLGQLHRSTIQFHFPQRQLTELKENISSQLPEGEWISHLDIPAGLLLQFFSISCTEKDLTAYNLYNLRSLPHTRFPTNYVGNAFTTRSCTLPTRDDSITLASCARKIRGLSLAISQKDVRQDMAYMNYMYDRNNDRSLYSDNTLAQGTANGYLMNNFARVPTYSVDFGPGQPSWCDYPKVFLPRYGVIWPDPRNDGVRVQITLPKKEMQKVLDLPKHIRQFQTAFTC